MSDQERYRTFELAARADPLFAAAGLLRTQAFDRYMLYEKDGDFTVAVGVAAEVVADRTAITLVERGTARTVPWRERGLGAVAELLGELPMPGWRGYGCAAFELSYLLAGDAEKAGPEPLLHLVIPEAEIVFGRERVTGRILAGTGHDDLPARVRNAPVISAGDYPPHARTLAVTTDSGRYQNTVAAAIRDIRRGKLQKVILSRTVPVDFAVDLLGTYVLGRMHNNPARSFLLDLGGLRAGGFSPEIVLQVTPDRLVRTQPLAGTRAVTGNPRHDEVLRRDLVRDPKEIFEHATSVRAAIDELDLICDAGSVHVREFMDVKRRGTVQHLGSMVGGRLAADRTAWDALATVFPAITASGIPKAGAYEAIRRYEPEPRHLYAGAVFTAAADGSLDAALVLRSIYQRDDRTWLRAGAGIVEQSRPAREYEETCEKLRSVAEHLVPAASERIPVASGRAAGGAR